MCLFGSVSSLEKSLLKSHVLDLDLWLSDPSGSAPANITFLFNLTVDVLLEQLDLAPRDSALFWQWRAVQFWVWFWVLLQSDTLGWKLQMCKAINSYKIKWNSINYENEGKSRRHGLNKYCFFLPIYFLFLENKTQETEPGFIYSKSIMIKNINKI